MTTFFISLGAGVLVLLAALSVRDMWIGRAPPQGPGGSSPHAADDPAPSRR